ncbi:unnamed protein product [Chrysoparadoxa australica]
MGVALSLFYAAWALAADSSKRYDLVAEVLLEGKRVGAKPQALLDEATAFFDKKMRLRQRALKLAGLDADGLGAEGPSSSDGSDEDADEGTSSSSSPAASPPRSSRQPLQCITNRQSKEQSKLSHGRGCKPDSARNTSLSGDAEAASIEQGSSRSSPCCSGSSGTVSTVSANSGVACSSSSSITPAASVPGCDTSQDGGSGTSSCRELSEEETRSSEEEVSSNISTTVRSQARSSCEESHGEREEHSGYWEQLVAAEFEEIGNEDGKKTSSSTAGIPGMTVEAEDKRRHTGKKRSSSTGVIANEAADVNQVKRQHMKQKDGRRRLPESSSHVRSRKRHKNGGSKGSNTGSQCMVVDPFWASLRRSSTVGSVGYQAWLTHCTNVYDFTLEQSLRAWPKKVGKGRGHEKALRGEGVFLGRLTGDGITLQLGKRSVVVKGILGEGAYGVVYSCKLKSSGEEVAVKVERPKATLPWEFYLILEFQRRLSAFRRIDNDLRLVKVVRPRQLFNYSDGYAMPMSLGRHGTLHDLVLAYKKAAVPVPEIIAMHYAREMIRYCRAVHQCQLLHMDIKPDQWLLGCMELEGSSKSKSSSTGVKEERATISLIDFGRAIDLRNFPDDVQFSCSEQQVADKEFMCIEMRLGRPWRHQVDLYGVATCIHFLLHGSYLEVMKISEGMWLPTQRPKRYWEGRAWDQVFCKLINCESRALEDVLQVLLDVQGILDEAMRGLREDKLPDLLRQQWDLVFRR